MKFLPETDVLLLDASGFIFRAYFGLPHLTTATGLPTNALYGFSRMMEKLITEFSPQRCVVVFDAGRENFRHALYPAYKANRKEMPSDLAQQMPYFTQIASALGFTTLALPGYEADDLIGTLCSQLSERVTVVTGDKDLTQLVNNRVSLYDAMKDRWTDHENVKDYYGVAADQFIDYLAIVGDSSDNIPGIRGVGPKSAVALLNHFKTLDRMLAEQEVIKDLKGLRGKDSITQAVKEGSDTIKLSRVLATIKCDIPLFELFQGALITGETKEITDLNDLLERRPGNTTSLAKLVEQFEFKDVFTSLLGEQQNGASIVTPNVFKAVTVWHKNVPEFISILEKQPIFAFDLETTSLNPREAEVVGVSFCFNNEVSYYIPCGHVGASLLENRDNIASQISWPELQEVLRPIMGSAAAQKVGQNIKFDASILEEQGVTVNGIYFDTMVAGWVIAPDRASYSLSALAKEYLNYTCTSYDQTVGKLQNFSQVSIEKATHYGAEDAYIAWRLKDVFLQQLTTLEMWGVYEKVEMPLVRILAKMELHGILLDKTVLESLGSEWSASLLAMEEGIFESAGGTFNINSPKQLSEILFIRLQLPAKGIKKTTFGFSTDSSALEKLTPWSELPKKILAYRHLNKLMTTYADALPKQIDARSGRVHSNFRQTGTGTGRLSSNEPNLQNIPIATSEGRRIRKAFVATPGHVFIAADYSQIELRLLAHLSGDERLIESFLENADIHELTAREVLNVKEGQTVSKSERRFGKIINFGIIYGMGAFRLGQELGIPLSSAQNYIDLYFKRYPRVKDFFESCYEMAEQKGEVRSVIGRRRILKDVAGGSDRDLKFLARVAVNSPIQGSAADLVKLAMIEVDKHIAAKNLPAYLVLQIHDELIYEVHQDCSQTFVEGVRAWMEGVLALKVPLKVDMKQGHNWQQLGEEGVN
jgi:DNA polymerase I